MRAEVARAATGGFLLKIAATFLRLVLGIMLARLLGAEGYGVYAFAIAMVGLLQVPTQLGLPQLLVREVAVYREREQWSLLRGLVLRANQGILLVAILIGLLAFAFTAVFPDLLAADGGSAGASRTQVFWLALLILPLSTLAALRQSTLRGLRYVVLGQTPELVVQPSVLIVALLGAYLALGSEALTPLTVVGLNVASFALAFALGAYWLLRRLPPQVKLAKPAFAGRQWIGAALPFLVLAGMAVVNNRIDLVMLGFLRTNEEVGVYQAAVTGGALVIFGLSAVNAATAPQLARFWSRGDVARLQRIATGSARASLALALPAALVLGVGGEFLLGLLFGEEFKMGATALALIALGQLVNAGFGSVGFILNMTGHTNLSVRGVGAAAVSNVILNALLIPRYGMEGSAFATLMSFVIWNSILFYYVRRELGVNSTVFGRR